MTASPPSTAEQSLADRYGDRSRHWARLLLIGVLALGFVGWVGWAALDHASPRYGAKIRSYDVTSPHTVKVVLDARRPEHQPLVCTVTAQAEDHAVVGEARVRVPIGAEGDVTVSATVRTDRQATTAVVSGCE